MHSPEELKQKREAVYSGFRENTQGLYKLFRDFVHVNATEAEIQYKIGITLCGDNPLSQDYEEAVQLFKLSAAQGNKEAKDVLEKLPAIRLKHELAMLQTTELKRAATPTDKRKTVPDSSKSASVTAAHIAELRRDTNTSGVPQKAKKETEKKNKQEKKPEIRQEKSSAQDSSLTKTVPSITLFSTALQTKITKLIKMRSKIDEMRRLQEGIALDIKKSSDILAQPLTDSTTNKDRHLKLEANLADLRSLERYDASIKVQETLFNNFLPLLQGSQGTLSDEALQKNLTVVDDKTKSKPIFTAEEFLALQQALTKNKSFNDDVFNCSFAVLEEKYPLVDEVFSRGLSVLEAKYTLLFAMVSALGDKLISLSDLLKKRAAEHSEFGICTKEEEPQRILPPAKMSRIRDAVAQIKSILNQLIKTEEKTTQDRVVQDPQKTSASQGSGSQSSENERGEPARRVPRAAREQDQPPAELVPKKLSKAARKKAYEERAAAKAARIAAHKQSKAQDAQKKRRDAEVAVIERIQSDILPKGAVFPVFPVAVCEPETKAAREEKTTVERQNPMFKEKTIESYNELQKLKSIIKIIKKTGVWTPERKYAILQSFAFLNDVVSVQHEHPATKAVAKRLRNATFKQYKEVMDIVQSAESLLGMVNAWITFLETPNDICFFVNERAVLDKVSSDWLNRVYELGEALSREVDIDKSCIAFKEMMDFGRCQRYETACSIRLILGKIRKFQGLIKAGREIIIMPDEETFIVYYKNRNNCEMVSFHCDEDQRALLLKLMFNGEALVRNSSLDAEVVYKQIYAAVAAKEGCTHLGDDIIACEAARFYWAITGTERGTLEQAVKAGNSRALALLKQFAPQLFRPEHLERGKRARHFEVLEEETKSINESANTNFGGGLFALNMQSLTSPSLSPVVPAVTFVFPACRRDPKVDSQSSSQNSATNQNSSQQVKSESPKSTGH